MSGEQFQRDLSDCKQALGRARFWGGLGSLFTLGIWDNSANIARFEGLANQAELDVKALDSLKGDLDRLRAFLDESVVENGVRIALCVFPDLALNGLQTYGPNWDTLRRFILDRDGSFCQHADGSCNGPLQIHHIRPLSKGGTNDHANLITLCRRHHGLQHPHNPAFHR